MLVGVLCAVVDAVRETEIEKSEILDVKEGLWHLILASDGDDSGTVSISDFVKLLNNPVAVRFLQSVDIDAYALVEFADTFFKGGQVYDYADIIGLLLDLRGRNVCTVKEFMKLIQKT